MKLYYYFNLKKDKLDLFFILRQLNPGEEAEIWLKKIIMDTNCIRVDSVESKLVKGMFR